jgi:anti-sigma regulatory factor (Ser/Thr protein kinase)
VREFLNQIGFDKFANAGGSAPLQIEPGTLKLRQLDALDPLYVRSVAELLAQRVPGTSEEAQHTIELCLNELLQNVFEHADSRIGCFVQARWHAERENVRLAVVDGGIGIPSALRRKLVASLQRSGDDNVIIAAVTHRGISSRAGGRPGGLGLKLLREIAVERGGCVTVIAGNAKVIFKQTGPRIYKSPVFRGTAIEIDFRPTIPASPPGEEIF